jgi:radical SAM superfamily enzyme YgiQ (UPF0313 family)
MRKGAVLESFNLREDIRRFQDHGIGIYGSFVFGYDDDRTDIFDRTLEFVLEQGFILCNFNTLCPMPGTPLYERLKKEGRLLSEAWWLDARFPYGEPAFIPALMTEEELRNGCRGIRKRFYRFSSITRRLFGSLLRPTGISRGFLYLLANLAARREIRTKMKRLRRG